MPPLVDLGVFAPSFGAADEPENGAEEAGSRDDQAARLSVIGLKLA
jgi:hypothetical protein